ncbi:MAG: Oligopeptide transport system permease protein OppC [uncultured Thermomicrobiales bacterium]|uniref:Oligopeptide transport system permease protein OppC n=1 Tax=uncultured Thermomicrobiales bacterium TaxID=1645740 RepID=A0A6J4U9C2_9BACT|nr:MAG: Oligopeptide transport system permease protein OppC [uncultured Thermomicrobiales bacterium]
MVQTTEALNQQVSSQRTLGAALERKAKPVAGFWTSAWRRFRRDRLAMVALALSVAIVLFAVFAPLVSLLTGFTYQENHLAQKLTPVNTDGYVLGADGNGRDVLTRLAYGGRISLLFATLGAVSTLILGAILGAISGYFGRWIDTVIMRTVDVILSLPTLVVLILIGSFYDTTVWTLAIFVALVSWTGVARLVRGQVLTLRSRDFVEAARVIGANDRQIIGRHILPNVVPIVVVWLSLSVPGLILLETSLSYLGVGIRVPTPSWGNMLQEAQATFRQSWTLVFIPGFMVFLTALCLSLVGNGVRDAVDPRLTNE